MPKLFSIGEYVIYFWSNENNEPIHVHVSRKRPGTVSAKIWLTKSGGCILADNSAKIPIVVLKELMEIISAQFFMICAKWKNHFLVDTIEFYC